MLITTLDGDLLDQEVDVIAHQVNCLGVMGAGVAWQIKNRYPKVCGEYERFCKNELRQLGTLQTKYLLGRCLVCVQDNESPAVANLFGQDRCGDNGRPTDYNAIYDALIRLREIMESRKWETVAFPYGMSCGLGGGSWNVIFAMIQDVFENSDMEVRIVRKNNNPIES